MAAKFHPGAVVYTQKGRSYVVDEVEDGIVYCSTPGGAETEFSAAALLTEAEWKARSDNSGGLLYQRLKQHRLYTTPPAKLDAVAAAQAVAKIERLTAGILDFVAFSIAARILAETGDEDLAAGLSIVKCREVFEAASPELRASLLASFLGAAPAVLVGAGKLGDNLMRAMIEKGMAAHGPAFASFGDRKRE